MRHDNKVESKKETDTCTAPIPIPLSLKLINVLKD